MLDEPQGNRTLGGAINIGNLGRNIPIYFRSRLYGPRPYSLQRIFAGGTTFSRIYAHQRVPLASMILAHRPLTFSYVTLGVVRA